ncbi:MAG TPA: hypothetical protein VGB24_18395 [Longimicrobium sp.]|jgi:hypothetical protein
MNDMNPIASHLLWQIINRSGAPTTTPPTGAATSFSIDDIINPRGPRRVEDAAPVRPLAKAA